MSEQPGVGPGNQDFEFWKTVPAGNSWPAVFAKQGPRGLAVLCGFGVLAYIIFRTTGAGSTLEPQGLAVAILIALLAFIITVVAVVKEINHGPGSKKPPDKTPKRRNVKRRTRKARTPS